MKSNQLALAALRAITRQDTAEADVHRHAPDLPSFDGATAWLNSSPLTGADLRGKTVVVDFWTYTCVNWLRTLPYVRAWADKYADRGLVVIGVHTPEFSFEKDAANVQRAVRAMDIRYPVAIDSDYAIWQAFDNHYWPALYLADAHGHLRHHHFGEGEYVQSEMIIKKLLKESGADGIGTEFVSVEADGVEAAADLATLWSAENYLGLLRTENFASPTRPQLDRPMVYAAPDALARNDWAPSGNWTLGSEAAVLDAAHGRISTRFHARDVNLVMGPDMPGNEVRFRVLIDGQPPIAAHGVDVVEDGYGTVREQRMYQLIRQPPPIVDREFTIEFVDPGIAAYAFTFG